MSEEPSKKRKLETETENKPPPSLEDNIDIAKDAKLWFEDGNIVIIAENHPFKIHKGVLAAKSDFFSGMFSLPQPQTLEESEHFDGIPTMHLSDKWQDVRCVLQGIYHSDLLLKPGNEAALPLHTITSWLRLGSKYEIESLREAAKAHLSAAYPPISTHELHQSRGFYRDGLFGSGRHLGHIEVINLIRQDDRRDLVSSLPAAFYECSRLPVEFLLQGLEDEDLPSLSPSDLINLLEGKQAIIKDDLLFLEQLVMHTCPPMCRDRMSCHAHANAFYKDHWSLTVGKAGDLLSNRHSISERIDESKLCQECKKRVKHALSVYCERTWKNLRETFIIAPW